MWQSAVLPRQLRPALEGPDVHPIVSPERPAAPSSAIMPGVVNPPAAGKYQHWINVGAADSLDAFVAGAREVKGSWWNDWADWLRAHAPATVAADGARVPGAGALPAIEDAPGSYVRTR